VVYGAVADPRAVWGVIHGFGAYWATVAAVRLGVFDALTDGVLDAPALARRCHADAPRMDVLCAALATTGLLCRQPDGYGLTPTSDAFLVAGRERSMRDLLLWSPGPHGNWPHLDATVAGAPPVAPVDDEPAAFYVPLVAATFPSQLAAARVVAERLGMAGAARVMDLGAGAAPWTIALLDACPAATALVNDLPEVLPVAVEHAERFGVAARCDFVAGDYASIPLPASTADIAVLANVVRAEADDAAGALVRRAAATLRPGGRLLLVDYFLDDGGAPSATTTAAALLGLTMMASTRHGRTYTRAHATSWLHAAGLRDVELLEPLPPVQVLIGVSHDRSE
jgi:ubiquinone/menaquinone biosynthesis C-methylase UbiE